MRKYSGTRRETIPLKIMDFFVGIYAKLIYKKENKEPISENPTILIASLGHLGDALTVSYIFPLIKKTYPTAKIDFLTADWCGAVVKENPYLRNVFFINHFQTNRRNISFAEKLKSHFKTFKIATKELQKESYDYYIDIRYTDAVAHFVLPFMKVKKSFGFSRRGFGDLLTKEFDVPSYDEFHHFDMYLMLLKEIGVQATLKDIEPYFLLPPTLSLSSICEKIQLLSKDFLLIFPETGATKKELSLDFWSKMIQELVAKNLDKTLVFCGQTTISAQIIDVVNKATNNKFAKNLLDSSNKISINELAFLSKYATFAITLDSFPAHLCCIFCETIMLFKVTGYPFFPLANFPVLLIHGHEPSKNMEFSRKNVTIIYQEPFESDEVIDLVVKKTAGEKILYDKVS